MSSPKKRRKLTEAEWTKIVTLWELGQATQEELANMFDCTKQAIYMGLRNRGSVKGSKRHIVGDSMIEAAKSDAARQVEEIDSMKQRYIQYADLLAKLLIKAISDKAKSGLPVSDAKEDVVTLQKAAAAMETLRSSNYHLYGLNDPDQVTDEMPEIVMTEMTAEEIEAINKNFEIDDDGDRLSEMEELAAVDVDLPFDDDDEDDEE